MCIRTGRKRCGCQKMLCKSGYVFVYVSTGGRGVVVCCVVDEHTDVVDDGRHLGVSGVERLSAVAMHVAHARRISRHVGVWVVVELQRRSVFGCLKKTETFLTALSTARAHRTPRAPRVPTANGRPGFPFGFLGCWRALAKGTAWAGLWCNSTSCRLKLPPQGNCNSIPQNFPVVRWSTARIAPPSRAGGLMPRQR